MRILPAGTAVAVAVALIGLAGPVSASAVSSSDRHDGPHVVRVTEDRTGAIRVSSTRFHEGVVRFDVSTSNPKGAAITLFQLNKGVTIAKAARDVKEEFSNDPRIAAKGTRDLNRDITFYGLADVTPGQPASVTERLYDGTYYAVDVNTPGGQTLQKVVTIKVTEGGDEHARLDTAGLASVLLTSADRFVVNGHLPAKGSVVVRNVGDTIHFMQIEPVKPGTTDAQVQAFFDSGFQGPPPFINGPFTAMDVLSPGHQLVLSYSLPKGTYVLLCFVADDETGMPHAFMGMHKVVKLS
jgi:hypothetical protein